MKDVIIFDTNAIHHEGLGAFLGGRELLRQLEPDAEFYIPELVLDEVKRQKKRKFDKSKAQLLGNDLVKSFSPDLSEIESMDIDAHIEQIQQNENFAFQTIPCVHGEVVDQFRSMAILNQAPFNKDSDKGFKDACIYVSVLNHLEQLGDRSVFFWGRDGRLKEAFDVHPTVTVVNTLETYHRKSSRFLMDDYFFGILSTELEFDVTSEDIGRTWRNNADNWIIEVIKNDSTYLVEIESREVVIAVEEEDLDGKVSALVSSGSFSRTHSAVADLIDLVSLLSPQHLESLNQAAEANSQVNWLLSDDDVKEFFDALNP